MNEAKSPTYHGTIRQWYDEHASLFGEAGAIELAFIGLGAAQRERLNRFKLWPFREGGLLQWEGADVLDFGAGHGRFAFEFRGYRSYLGIDLSSKLVAMGRERFRAAGLANSNLEVGDCLDFQGSSARYDIVCALGMLPYVQDLGAAIRQMARQLKPGGSVAGDFRRSSPLYDRVRRLKWKFTGQTGGTSRIDTESEMRTALMSAGLTEITIIMREYPLLGSWYAHRGWEWPLRLRNMLSRRRWLNWLATEGCFVAKRPVTA